MSKAQIAGLLFQMKKNHQTLVSVERELFSVDELLSRYLGREVTEDVGQEFVRA